MRSSWEAMSKGQTNAAVAILEKAYGQGAFKADRAVLLREILFHYLRTDQPAEAQARFLKAADVDAQSAASVLGIVESYLFEKQKYAELADWCKTLGGRSFPEAARVQLVGWRMRALQATGKFAEALAVLKASGKQFAPQATLQLASGFADALIRQAKVEEARQLITYIETELPSSPERDSAALSLRVGLLTSQAQWPEATALFREKAGKLSDAEAASILDRIARPASQSAKLDVVDELCVFVLESLKDHANTGAAAARWWIQSAQTQGKMAMVMERLARLQTEGLPLSALLDLVDTCYTDVLGKGAPEDMKALIRFCQGLSANATKDEQKSMLAGVMLDASFCAEDYATALQILEAGVPGHDADWHAMLLPKVKAHVAQKEGRLLDAVAEYRAFMQKIAKDQKDQVDPITGKRVTWEMILGLNAKRIGDLLTSASKPDDAKAAYVEARQDYAKALGRLEKTSDEYRQVQAEMQALPAGE